MNFLATQYIAMNALSLKSAISCMILGNFLAKPHFAHLSGRGNNSNHSRRLLTEIVSVAETLPQSTERSVLAWHRDEQACAHWRLHYSSCPPPALPSSSTELLSNHRKVGRWKNFQSVLIVSEPAHLEESPVLRCSFSDLLPSTVSSHI